MSRIAITQESLPLYLEFTADGIGVGKTLLAQRTRYQLDQSDVPSTLVRIESSGVERTKMRRGDVFIAVESFAQADRAPGGLVGVLQPLYAAITKSREAKGAVLVDWAGGLAQHRAEMFAATRFDERLASLGVTGVSFVLTTNATDRMREAAHNLTTLATVAPGLGRCLVRNARLGTFDFVTGCAAHDAHRALMTAAKDATVIDIPAIRGDSWRVCEEAGLTMPSVLAADPPQLAAQLGLDEFTAAACATEVAAWWALTDRALKQVFRFPLATKQDREARRQA